MLFIALGGALLLFWIWRRSPAVRAGGWRVGAGLIAGAVLVTGAGLTIRGDWPIGFSLLGLGLFLAFSGRAYRGGRGAAPRTESMSVTEARSILGVGPDASPEEIKAAYMRLMKLNHPDQGGTSGLASKLNAARETLLKG